MNAKPIEILLVEDNEGDVFLTKRAFKKARIANNITVARDGEIAINILQKTDEYKDFPKPDIIFLDINLPKKDGKQVLKVIKNNDGLKRIPVIILTSSKAEQDVLKTYDLHANGYIVKPLDIDQFHEVVSAIEDFWFTIVTMPS